MEILKSFKWQAWAVPSLVLTAAVLGYTGSPNIASAAQNTWGNPCDVRDACSSDPGTYAGYRENGNIKAREYVGEMRWGTGGAPDDVYVISRTVGSRDFSGAKPCEVRDFCGGALQNRKTVRSGPSAHDSAPVAGDAEAVLSKVTADR